MTKKTQFSVIFARGSVETLVTRGEITNHCLIACSLSNISAKNYENRLMCIEVSVLHQCSCLKTQCTYIAPKT